MKVFYKSLIVLLALQFYAIETYASLPSGLQEKLNTFSKSKNVAYSITAPGRKNSDGSLTAAKIYNIVRLPKEDYIPNVVIIKTVDRYLVNDGDKGFYSTALQSSLGGLNIESIRAPFGDFNHGSLLSADEYGIGRIYEVRYTAPVDPYDVCIDLMKNPEIEYAVPQFMRYVYDYTPNDPRLAQNQQWYISKLQLKKAWDISKGSKSVVIGIVDSGTDWQHEDLSANIRTNPKEIENNSIDDDGNGFVDDVRGWDFVGNITANEAWAGGYKPDNNPKNTGTSADNTHGTHVAGCASAVTDNGIGIAGTGFNCMLYPVKCGSDNSQVRGIYRGYEGIMYAAKMGCQIVNCSWGGPGSSPAEQDVINQAAAMGTLVVVAAGNDNGLNIDEGGQYPACYENVLCVGATTSSDKVSSFSNIGNLVTVYTPGSGIMSTITGNKYQNSDGTSMASPVTAGVAALVKSIHSDWTPKQILHQIRSTCDNVLTTDTTLRPLFYGRTNAYKALDYNNGPNPQHYIGGVEMSSMTIEGGVTLTDYNTRHVTLELKNYLYPVMNLKVRITPLHNYIWVDKTDDALGLMDMNQTKTIDLNVRLLPNNPWFEGSAYILLTNEGEGYKDYQVIQIPIKIASLNSFLTTYQFQDALSVQMTGSATTALNSFWTVGTSMYGGLFYHASSGGPVANVISQKGVYTVFPFDDLNAVAGTGSTGGTADILYTANGGTNWGSVSVGSITDFINYINFFDKNNGIFTGDPLNNKWGIGYTSDGGKSWKQVVGVEPPNAGETAYLNAGWWQGDYGWFGTRSGRIYRTSNRGFNWKSSILRSGGEIFQLCFKDSLNGMAVYTENSSTSAPHHLAVTSDGGATWQTGKYNFTANVLTPVSFYIPPRSNKIICIFSGGQIYSTEDMGATWEPILSVKSVGAHSGAAFASGQNLRIWTSASKVSYLDTKYIPAGAKSILTIDSETSIKFDSVEVGKNKSLNMIVKSEGDLDVEFTSINFIPESGVGTEEFKFQFPPPDILETGTQRTLRIKFTPEAEGIRRATLKIFSNAETPEYDIALEGIGFIHTSVDENTLSQQSSLLLSPNPCTNNFSAIIDNSVGNNLELYIYDIYGRRVKYLKSTDLGNSSYLSVDVSELPAGIYYIKAAVGSMHYCEKLAVIR
ncbi:MAG: hypothetical protein QG635_351 [Bacteroidota bacterium]|nr:hypothetical protein [Bacteroidota bacterium]